MSRIRIPALLPIACRRESLSLLTVSSADLLVLTLPRWFLSLNQRLLWLVRSTIRQMLRSSFVGWFKEKSLLFQRPFILIDFVRTLMCLILSCLKKIWSIWMTWITTIVLSSTSSSVLEIRSGRMSGTMKIVSGSVQSFKGVLENISVVCSYLHEFCWKYLTL